MSNEDTMRQEFRKLHPNSEMQEQFAEAWKACAAIKDAEIAELKALNITTHEKELIARGHEAKVLEDLLKRYSFFHSEGGNWLRISIEQDIEERRKK